MNAETMTMIANAGLTATIDRDWAWITGDTYPFRDMLKKLGCRWSRKRQAWYLKPGEEKVIDLQEVKQEQDFNQEFHTDLSEGYLGAVKSDGSKSGKALWGTDLSKAIRTDLRDNITELKRSAINVSCDTYSGGQSIYVTLKMEKDKYFKCHNEWVKNAVENYFQVFSGTWVAYEDEYGQVKTVSRDLVFSDKMTLEEKEEFKHKVAEYQYKTKIGGASVFEVDNYHSDFNALYLTDAGMRILERVFQIIHAYHYDDSNSMVDYFDTNFYYTVKIKLM